MCPRCAPGVHRQITELPNFITRESFNDLITAANGLVLYFVDLICNHPKAPVVPWFLSSDNNEQLFARIRVGRYSGRRTQIDSTRVPEAMGRYNRLLEVENTLDVECGTSVHKTAHTRGKTLFRSEWSKHPEKKIAVDFGGSVKMSNLIQSLKRGSKSPRLERNSLFPLLVMEVRIFQVIMEMLFLKDGGVSNFHSHMVVKNNQMMNQTMRVKTIFLIMRTKSWLIAPLRSEFGGRR